MSLNLNNFAQDEEELIVRSFTLLETGEYNPVPIRTYDFSLTGDDELFIRNRLDSSRDSHPTVGAGLFQGRLNGILAPSAKPGSDVRIEGGWDNPRFRWQAEIEWKSKLRGGVVTQFVTGYTEPTRIKRFGDDEGRVDPRCRFYITSCMEITESMLSNGRGGGRNFLRMNNSNYVFSDPNFRGNGGSSRGATRRLMTISDVISSSSLSNEMRNAYRREGAYDTTGIIRDRVSLADRGDSNGARFLANLINQSNKAYKEMGQGYGDDRDEITNTSIINSSKSTTRDRFLSYLRSTLNSKDVQGVFEFDELEQAFPDLDRVMDIMFYDSSNQTDFADLLRNRHFDDVDWKLRRHTRGSNTKHLRGTGLVDQTASIMANTLPTIAYECGLSQMIFTVTNRVDSNRLGGRRYAFNYVHLASFSRFPPEIFREQFEARFSIEVLDNVSFDNEADFEFEFALDTRGDLKMDLFIDDGKMRGMEPFCYPAWGANTYSPQISEDSESFYRMSAGVKSLNELLADFNESRLGFNTERSRREQRDPMYDDNDPRDDDRESVFDRAEREDREDDDRAASRDRGERSEQGSVFSRRD